MYIYYILYIHLRIYMYMYSIYSVYIYIVLVSSLSTLLSPHADCSLQQLYPARVQPLPAAAHDLRHGRPVGPEHRVGVTFVLTGRCPGVRLRPRKGLETKRFATKTPRFEGEKPLNTALFGLRTGGKRCLKGDMA